MTASTPVSLPGLGAAGFALEYLQLPIRRDVRVVVQFEVQPSGTEAQTRIQTHTGTLIVTHAHQHPPNGPNVFENFIVHGIGWFYCSLPLTTIVDVVAVKLVP